jgi:murein DD-endopeptidase MepM/ murein hydrolase activator NlpD
MNSWRWITVFVYLILGFVLFGASTFYFGMRSEQEKLETLPRGTEVIGQGITSQSGKDVENIKNSGVAKELELAKANEVTKGKTVKTYSEADRIKAELALVGIKSAEESNKPLEPQAMESKNVESNIVKANIVEVKSAGKKSLSDFPSPIQGVPLKRAGNYYSEALQAYLFHAGTDYPQAEGAVIRVKHSGKVIYAGPDPILGQKVEVDCGEDWSVIYGGLENLRVKEGDRIEINEAIGQVGYYPGAEGVKDRPQLHYEVWHGDQVQIPSAS